MHFLIQLSLKEKVLTDYIIALEAIGAKYSFVGHFKDTNGFSGVPVIKDNFYSVSGISVLKTIANKNDIHFLDDYGNEIIDDTMQDRFSNSFFYSTPVNFDQKTAIDAGMPMLNKDAIFMDLNNHVNASFESDMFIKPSDDLKSFIGGILPSGISIRDFVLTKSSFMAGWNKGTVLIAPPREIHSEYRFFVVNGEPVTGSNYFKEGEINIALPIPDEVSIASKNLASQFQPDIAFTMDLALMKDGSISIVEYNCINTSGHYGCDLPLFLTTIKELY